MEAVLDIYARGAEPDFPLICMDEAAKRLTADTVEPLPMTPGQPRREDDHYERKGVASLFMFFDPHRGWRRVGLRDARRRVEWAEEMKMLLEVDYASATRVTVVCDNLNTHGIASFYEAFDAATARRLTRRLELVHTPPHGSWLNLAEVELSVLSRQCVGRRFADVGAMEGEIRAWESERNAGGLGANWTFTTAAAREKLGHLYPNACH